MPSFPKIVEEQAMPFPLRVPNHETEQAMQDVQEGTVDSFQSVEDLFQDLDGEEE
jgi:antitoxin component of RelBE/YafQ-DinJ toxin-antitoxin module